ncbi:NAD(P)H-dependent oxidoreductase [Cupriavidus basilensis]
MATAGPTGANHAQDPDSPVPPRFAHSKANRALCAAAATVPGVEIADLYACYPDGIIDVDAEVRRLRDADRIVFQFPVQWYATPALLKAWQDAVLTRMFYLAYDTEGRALEGKPLLVAATAGNVPQAYTPAGVNLFPLAELLQSLAGNRASLRPAVDGAIPAVRGRQAGQRCAGRRGRTLRGTIGAVGCRVRDGCPVPVQSRLASRPKIVQDAGSPPAVAYGRPFPPPPTTRAGGSDRPRPPAC